MNKTCIKNCIFACVLTLFSSNPSYALDERPRKGEHETISSMCESPWNNAEYFKKRFPEAFAETSECKKYMCADKKTPQLDYITNRDSLSFDVVLSRSIKIAAKPGGLEEKIYKLEYEATKAFEAGDINKADEIINRQKQIMKDNGLD